MGCGTTRRRCWGWGATRHQHHGSSAGLGCWVLCATPGSTTLCVHCCACVGQQAACGVGAGAWQLTVGELPQVLAEMVRCSMDKACIAPPGSTRNNHRHDQTVLNAILCAQQQHVCVEDKAWWPASIDATEDHDGDGSGVPLRPPADAAAWSDVRLYNRRQHAEKPYVRHLLRI